VSPSGRRDLATALVIVLVLVIIAPGWAIVGLVSMIVLGLGAFSFVLQRRRARRLRRGRRPPGPRGARPR